MATKAEMYREMADRATENLTAQITDWVKFLLFAGKFYRYSSFLDIVMIYTQRSDAKACAGYDLWKHRMNRQVRFGSKGIALLRYRDGRVFLRYVFDIADTERRENSRDPVLWQYQDGYEGAVTARLEEAFGVPGGDGLARQLITLAVQFADEHWHDFKDSLMCAVHDSLLDELDEDNVALRFRNAVTVSLAFLLLARCGFDLDSYFTPEDFACIGEFNTRDTVLALGNAVSESASVILRQVERAVKACMAGRTIAPPAPAQPTENRQPPEDAPAAGDEKPAAGPASPPEPEAPPAAAPEPPQEASEQLAMPGYSEPAAPAPGPVQARQEAPAKPAPAVANFRITDDDLGIGGPKAKYAANAAAIRVLKAVEADGRAASPDEQEILSRYVGWGGIPEAFDPDKPEWAVEYAELKSLLTESEYASARASTLNAHFTPPVVIRAIYEALGGMGFQSGNILEPSCGVGNFFGCLPESMAASRLYGVELDAISGRIAKLLYPKADISIRGFEDADFPDCFFDVAVGNVPFGNYRPPDRRYDKENLLIHDYFFAKAIDKVRAGGLIAFITSNGVSGGTMDKKDRHAREYIADRCDLLGAIRLPNGTFSANAGTDMAMDIMFLQKRAVPRTAGEPLPDWINTDVLHQNSHIGRDGQERRRHVTFSHYFKEHPEMVLGKLEITSGPFGPQLECRHIPGADLSGQLQAAIRNIRGEYQAVQPDEEDEEDAGETILADPSVKNYSYAVVDNEIYYRENSVMVKSKLNATAKARVKGMVRLRDCVQQLIDLQMDESVQDGDIRTKQAELNRLYDAFTPRYGLINGRGNRLAFDKDSSYYLLCSLEVLDDDGNLERKADIFTKRTIQNRQPVTHVDTAQEALAVSIGERARVDLLYMARLTGKTELELAEELGSGGLIYRDHSTLEWQTADEYLSGNVRRKLREARRAAEDDPAFQPNVDALIAAIPKDLEASEIEVRLGATWIAPEYVQQFMVETFRTPQKQRENIRVVFVKATASWFITNKSWINDRDVTAWTTYGTDRRSAYEILEESLNLRDVRVYDTVEDADGKERRVLNVKATTLAAQKQQMVRDAFKDWIWKDPERRRELVRVYNDIMNCVKPREYTGSHIVFHGINPSIQLKPHQLGAIAHVLYGGNTLLAHEVGAGKTFEMIASIMESKYLGLCSKAIMVVPNHLTQQTAAEFLRLYPAANILVTTKRDFETARRKKFCARIATGDWDAVIIGHSQFERIPMSYERQKRIIDGQIGDITAAISEVKASKGERFTIKQMERMKKDLKAKLEKLKADWKKDDVIAFEQLGVDRMFVDESQSYKNLFMYTKMRNVAGLSTAEAQKSTDMFTKCRYLDELTGNRGVVMATGTPISNSMTELFSIQRYLQYDRLQEMGMGTFDSWASRFGETVTALELAPEGTGYRARTRFSRFFNLPELMNIFKEVADIKTADQLDLDVPEVEYHTVVCKPTEHQKALVKELSKRAEKVHNGSVDAHTDNMLAITSDGRQLGLDQRIINPALPDEAGTKVNQCVANILKHWRDGEAAKLTQLVFSDISTPGKTGFNIYDDIKRKLIAAGMPPEQIAFIHDANTDEQKKLLFAKVRSGQVRVLIGSTQKMGTGTNVQDRLIASHDLDCPWLPSSLEQREGRIRRRGNMNKTVHVYRYVTEGTFDAYLYQILENKQKFISQIMTSRTPLRSCEDVDETALSFAEIKALCAGDPRIRERMELDVEVSKLKIMKADYQAKKFRLEDDAAKHIPAEIQRTEAMIAGIQADMDTLAAHPLSDGGFAGMKVNSRTYTEKDKAGEALIDAIAAVTETDPVEIGSYRGFTVAAQMVMFGDHKVNFKGVVSYTIDLGESATGNITRIDNALARLPEHMKEYQAKVADLRQQLESARAEAAKPFAMEAELQRKSARLAELDAALNLGGRAGADTTAA